MFLWANICFSALLALNFNSILVDFGKLIHTQGHCPFAASRVVKSERISECHQNGCEDVASKENFGGSIRVMNVITVLLRWN